MRRIQAAVPVSIDYSGIAGFKYPAGEASRSLAIEVLTRGTLLPIKEYLKKNNIEINSDDELLEFKLKNADRMVYRTNNKSFENLRINKTLAKVISPKGLEYIWWEGKQMLFLSDYTKSYEGDLWTDISSINLNKEGGVDFQNGKKPLKLLQKLLSMVDKKDAIVLDFFAGSGSTGEAVSRFNLLGNNMRYILCTNNENNICEEITYTRLKNVIDGYNKHEGIPSNLIYYKTDFVENSGNSDQAKYNLVEKVNELLCIKENVYCYDEVNSNDTYYHYFDSNRHLFIFTDHYNEFLFNSFVKLVNSYEGDKAVYIYSNDNSLDEIRTKNINGTIKPIPSKIYEIYKEIIEDIKEDL